MQTIFFKEILNLVYLRQHNEMNILRRVFHMEDKDRKDCGVCETCDAENVRVLYSYRLSKWQCEECDELSADGIWYGDD
jgi:ribosomal protein L37AE/L43A